MGDSRISSATHSGSEVLLDHASKIFSFPLIVREKWLQGKVVWNSNIGIAFAGNTLVGQNTALALAAIMSRLIALEGGEMIALHEVAELAGRVLRKYTIARGQKAELALVGWCPRSGKWQLFHIQYADENSRVDEISGEPGEFFLLGSHKTEIKERIQALRDSIEPYTINWWRAPKTTILQLIDEGIFPDIGGYGQLAIGSSPKVGMEIYSTLDSERAGGAQVLLSFLGLDYKEDINPVGSCFIGMGTML